MKKVLASAAYVLAIVGGIWVIWPLIPDDAHQLLSVSKGPPMFAKAEWGGLDCDQPESVRITISNRSDRTILQTQGEVLVFRRGYSKLVGSASFDTDKIISPGQTHSFCQAAPYSLQTRSNPPGELEFTIRDVSVKRTGS